MRPSIDETMLEIAMTLAKRATCQIRQVGCVLTDDKNFILSTGYNGQAMGMPHCTHLFPCDAFRDKSKSCLAIHAELNAIMRCPDINYIRNAYITDMPCLKCALALANTSCVRIVYLGEMGTITKHPLEVINGYTITTPIGTLA